MAKKTIADSDYRVLFIRPPFTRLKGLGQAPYFPLGIGYLSSVVNNIEGVSAQLYYSENTGPGEHPPVVDKESVFTSRSQSQQIYFDALKSMHHPVWDEIREVIEKFRPNLVGVSVLTPEVGSALKVTELIKTISPETLVVWGGVHPSFLPKQTLNLPGVDFVVAGEGEKAIVALVERLRDRLTTGHIQGVCSQNYSQENGYCFSMLQDNLDSIPFPARQDALFPERFSPVAMGSIMHSRGCPWRCGFCSSRKFWDEKVRFRSPENVMAEIQQVHRDFGIKIFTFWDDAFTADRAMTEKLCEEIIRSRLKIVWRTATRLDLLDDRMLRLMRRAGCVQLELGIESGSERMLRLIRKDIDTHEIPKILERVHQHGIACGVFFMAGFPDETEADILDTLKLMKNIKPAEIVLNIFDPMPGSEQYDRAKELNLIDEEPDFTRYKLWPDRHFVADISSQRFNELAEVLSKFVFSYNSSRTALIRRAKPEILQLLRSDRKVLIQKGIRFIQRRFQGRR